MKRKHAWKVTTKDRTSVVVDNRYYKNLAGYQDNFILSYNKDNIVEAKEGTMGIFLFETREQARNWKKKLDHNFSYTKAKVLKVELLSKTYKPTHIGYFLQLENYYRWPKDLFYRTPTIEGTICCHKIKVLD